MNAEETCPDLVAEERALRAFVQRVGLARARARWVEWFVRLVAPGLAIAALVWLVSPTAAVVTAVAVSAVALGLGIAASLAERRQVRASLLALKDRGIPLADLLLAFCDDNASGREGSAMRSWLRTDLAALIQRLPAREERNWLAPRLGFLRHAVPIAVAVWILVALLPDFDLETPGFSTPPEQALASGGAGDSSGPRTARPTHGASDPDSPRQDRPDAPEDAEKPPVRNDEQEPDAEPAPFLDLPPESKVLVPDLVRDGPTRKAMARRALVGEEEGGEAAPVAAPQGGVGDDPRTLPVRSRDEFARAKERALQDRRVPERERAIVRRFFDLLQEGGK